MHNHACSYVAHPPPPPPSNKIQKVIINYKYFPHFYIMEENQPIIQVHNYTVPLSVIVH